MWFFDAAAIAHHQRFGGIDLRRDDERDNRQVARSGSGQRTGAEIADLYIAGGNRRDHFRAAVEASPVDGLADGFFIKAIGLGDFAGVDSGLITDGEVRRLGGERKCERYTNCNNWSG
ncbi:hypothetical protein D3C80_1103960 [compost metagenome]